ncbi:MAG: small conductance mechanosensitive channel [Solirubrobacteraceae bacterium]|nr:small conductance mechanosensitive channel [Solirubrobacteraceae bacterium]
MNDLSALARARALHARHGRHADGRERPWFDVSAAVLEISRRAVKRARIELVVLLPLLASVLLLYGYRDRLFPPAWDPGVRLVAAGALIATGWMLARSAGRALRPWLFKRLEPATAGTVGFLIRLTTMSVVVVVALRVAGLGSSELALGGAVTAVIVGLAAQQTLGQVIAGSVLASAQPFRVGERVRLQGGSLAGTIEGQVTSLGLLYTTMAQGENEILIPNSVVMAVAIVPLRGPPGIDLRARLHAGVTPEEVERVLRDAIQTSLRDGPHVELEELDADEVVVRITATPTRHADGPRLASEAVQALVPYAVSASEDDEQHAV